MTVGVCGWSLSRHQELESVRSAVKLAILAKYVVQHAVDQLVFPFQKVKSNSIASSTMCIAYR